MYPMKGVLSDPQKQDIVNKLLASIEGEKRKCQ